uniref:Uncharacterized protein n=1 Tax=Marmota marmota marmota TaxID=9994 RepID=A0A8C5YSE2_MARMA
MPGTVMAKGTFSFKKLLNQCKNQGLKSPGGIATPPVYGQLLDLYLLHNDTSNSVYVVNYIYWFLYLETNLCPWDDYDYDYDNPLDYGALSL